MPARVVVKLKDGSSLTHEVQDYPGLSSRPFTWQNSVDKFDELVEGRVDPALAGAIKDAVNSLGCPARLLAY